MPLGNEEIESRFGFHRATLEGANATNEIHKNLRIAFKEFAATLDIAVPDGRYKTLAFTELETASMWFHKAIAQQSPILVE